MQREHDSGNLAATRHCAGILVRMLRDPAVAGLVVSQGWAAAAELDTQMTYLCEWGERPDAFLAILYCAALGWVA